MEHIVLERSDGIATITLNRPDKGNAFNTRMVEEWAEALVECRDDDGVRAIIITGAGKNFCSGGDIDNMDKQSRESALVNKERLWRKIHRVALTIEDIDKPVLSAVNGAATGAGMDMALMADLVFAGRSTRFAESYIKMGLVPGDGGCYLLPRLVGIPKALELLWTGRTILAEEAERLGIVNRVVPDDELLDETRRFAATLANSPYVAIRMIKRAVYQSARLDLRTSLDLISSHMGAVKGTEDHRRAIEAFRSKSKPKFEGS